MSYYSNADEIFEVGALIEKNGKAFYEAAAEAAESREVADLCRELASWETRHVELFESLRRSLPDEAREGAAFDPGEEIQGYLRSAAAAHVFVKNKDPKALAKNCRSGRDILDAALVFEKDSVVFYAAMKNAVPKHLGGEGIDSLIEEELKHIQILSRHRDALPG